MIHLTIQALSLISTGPYGSDISESHGRKLQSADLTQQFDGGAETSVGDPYYLYNGRGRYFEHHLAGAVENMLASKWRHDRTLNNPCNNYGSMWDVGFKDTYRKPLETMKMLGVKPGMKVAEVGRLNGYWVPILAAAVGKEGKVYHGNNYAIGLENDYVWYMRSLRADAQNASIALVDVNTNTAAGADLVNGVCVDDAMMQTTLSRAGFEPGSPAVPFLDLRKGFSSMDFGADAGHMDMILMQYVLNFQSEDFVRDPLHAIFDTIWNNLKSGGIFYVVDYECDSSAMSRENSRNCHAMPPTVDHTTVDYTNPAAIAAARSKISSYNLHLLGSGETFSLTDPDNIMPTGLPWDKFVDDFNYDCPLMTKFGAAPLYENPTPEQTRECAHWIARKTHDLYITSGTLGRWKAANEDPTFPDQSFQLWEPKTVEGLTGTHYTERVYRYDSSIVKFELKARGIYGYCEESYEFKNQYDNHKRAMWVGGSEGRPDRYSFICRKPAATPTCGVIQEVFQASDCCHKSADTLATCTA